MNVEVVFGIERHYHSSVVILAAAKCVSCLLSTNNMAELEEDLSVRMCHESCVSKALAVNIDC
jgi:hypothetical protein